MTRRFLTRCLLVILVGLWATEIASAQSTFTWTATTASAAWGASASWDLGGTGPGSTSVTSNTDIAKFDTAAGTTTVQLDFATIGPTRYLGEIQFTGSNPTARTLSSSTATAGTLVLNGSGGDNRIIDNASTLPVIIAPGTGNMALQLAQSNSTISNVLGTSSTNTGLLTISANIGQGVSPAGITKIGSGVLLLSGTNSFTGPTVVQGGFIEYSAPGALYGSTSGSLSSNVNATNLVVQSGGAMIFRVGSGGFATGDFDNIKALGTGAGGFMNGSAIGIDTSIAALTYNGTIADTNGGANSIGFYKFGANNLTLTGNNTYTGGTFIRQAVVAVSGNQAGLPSGGNVTIGDPSNAVNTAQLAIGTTSQSSPTTSTLGSVTATGTGSSNQQLFLLNVPASPTANTTTVTMNAFTLTRGVATSSGTGTVTLNINGPLQLVSSPGSGSINFNATFNVPTLTTYGSATPISFSAQQSGSNAGFLGSRINLNNTTLVVGTNFNQDGNVTTGSTATAQVTFQNSATLRLSNNVPVLLTTSLSNALTNPLPILGFGQGSGTPVVSGTIDTNGFSTTINTPITNVVNTAASGAINVIGGGTLSVNGHNSFNGGVILAANTTLNINNGGVAAQANIAASYASGASVVTVSPSVIPSLVLGQRLTGSGSTIAAGTFIRAIDTVANTVTFSQNAAGAGTNLSTVATSSLGNGTFTINGGTIDNTSGSPVTLATNNAQSWAGDFAFTGTNDLNLGTGAVTMTGSRNVAVNGGTLTVGGAIGGSTFSLTKNGGGTLLTTGTNSYTGGTNVNNGTFQVQSGSLSTTGTVNVNGGSTFGGTLRGAGTIGGPVVVNGGTVPGTVRPGNSVGTLTLSNGLTTNGNGQLAFELLNGMTPNPGGFDSGNSTTGTIPNPTSNAFLDIAGGLTLSNATTIEVFGTGISFDPSQTYSFQVGRVTSSAADASINNLSQFNFVNFNAAPTTASFHELAAGQVYLNFGFSSVPEPGSLSLAVVAGMGLLPAFRRMRARRRAEDRPARTGGCHAS
jgi:autotransporter-associated beta strand protein